MADEKPQFDLCYPCSHYLPDNKNNLKNSTGKIVFPKSAALFWERLLSMSPERVELNTGAKFVDDSFYSLSVLGKTVNVFPEKQTIKLHGSYSFEEWNARIPFLALVYLATATPLSNTMLTLPELYPGREVFKGLLNIDYKLIEDNFGQNASDLLNASKLVQASPLESADVSCRFHLFPHFPIDYILWLKDDEFPAKLTILVSKNSASLPMDAIAAMVNLLGRLVMNNSGY